ncbi:MAG: serine/threonine-protein kinase [Gammaproteobacteria bacterium]|nr:serine/threonine-protein kinase [Gammaproteobacteria bacterium]
MKIPGYSIERLIGKGGMSSVYLAVQESLNRRVALKVMKKFDDPKRADRFIHEGQIIAALNHRNIITIHDVGTFGDRHFIAMEYLQGRALTERIDEGMSLAKVLSLLEQMAGCLHFVHRRGIIHRDIKPSNILFHADGTPKLTDFGIAKLVDADQEMTLEGNTLGSPYYLSPEQAEGLPLDGRSDIYALGIVFYQMLTGQRPYAKSSPVETIVAHLTQPLPVLPEPFAAYQALLDGMLAKSPDDRIGTAKELVYRIREAKRVAHPGERATDRVAAPAAPLPPTDNAAAGTRSRRHLAAASVGVVALLVITAGLVRAPDDATDPVVPARVAGGPSALAAAPLPRPADVARVAAPGEHAAAAERPADRSLTPASVGDPPGAASALPTPTAADNAGPQPTEAAASDAPSAAVAAAAPVGAVTADEPPERDRDSAAAPAVRAVVSDAQRVDDWMRAAAKASAALRLTRPADDNAYAYYRKVLAVEPRHRGALAGLQGIADRYRALASKALESDRDERARRYVRRGLGVRPGDPQLLALREQIDARERAAAVAQAEVVVEPPTAAGEVASEPPAPEGVRGREGSGNIVKDFKRVWRAVFD